MLWDTKFVQFPPIPAKLAKYGFWLNANFLAYFTAFSLKYGLTTSIVVPLFFEGIVLRFYSKNTDFVKNLYCNVKKYVV